MWKGILFFLVSAGVITMGLYSLTRLPLAVKNQKEPMPFEINYADRVEKENTGVSSYLQIPSLYLYADIETVKRDENGKMTKPKDPYHVGLYAEEDKRLGLGGVMVMAGDFDREDGRPSVFYYLSALEKDDIIQVTDLNGKKYNYIVYDKALYSWDTTDVRSFLIKSQTPRLDLITYQAHTEENRNKDVSKTIIYAEMK